MLLVEEQTKLLACVFALVFLQRCSPRQLVSHFYQIGSQLSLSFPLKTMLKMAIIKATAPATDEITVSVSFIPGKLANNPQSCQRSRAVAVAVALRHSIFSVAITSIFPAKSAVGAAMIMRQQPLSICEACLSNWHFCHAPSFLACPAR